MTGASTKRTWKPVAVVGLLLAVIIWVAAMMPPAAQAGDDIKSATSCCELYGLWVFAPQGAHGSFLPNNRFLWQSRIYLYDCSGPTITFDWEKGVMHDMRLVSANILEFKDNSGKKYKAVRKSNKVVVNGKVHRACPGK